ncbi:MAG: hypothetical protein K8H88_04545 [Sandaracinaceae bacterium]|nr:hypothetical protein [Sandaracinaceae bacterium]
MSIRATVHNGRLIVDEATDLPEGTVLDLVIDDEQDALDDSQRAALDAAITRSIEQARRGESAPSEKILTKLRSRRAG